MFKKNRARRVPNEVQQVLASAAYRTVRAALARKMLNDPAMAGSVRINDDPDGPLILRTDDAAVNGESPRRYEVTTEEIWPYLVEKHTPRYGNGAGIMVELTQ